MKVNNGNENNIIFDFKSFSVFISWQLSSTAKCQKIHIARALLKMLNYMQRYVFTPFNYKTLVDLLHLFNLEQNFVTTRSLFTNFDNKCRITKMHINDCFLVFS